MTWTIAELYEARSALDSADRERFDRLYAVTVDSGELSLPPAMVPWVEETYGSTDQVVEQQIVKVTNRWTLQTSLFNPFRAQRPQKDGDSGSLADEIFGDGPDPFDEPEERTSEDTFGRIRGQHCMTASNLAKSDAQHGVIVFREHNPWMITEDAFYDAIEVAKAWFAQCRQARENAIYPLAIWNCLWKSGASINHAHMQLLMTGSMHYGEIERLRRVAVEYQSQHESRYVDDLFRTHQSLGLGFEGNGIRLLAHLTPLLSRECVLFADKLDEGFARTIHRVIRLMNEQMDVTSFNLAVIPHPLAETEEDWSVLPVVARLVDRGNPLKRTVDTGAMELFAASVVSSDPFEVAELLRTVELG